MIPVTNKTEYPTREVNRLVRKALGYLDLNNDPQLDVVVCHFQKKTGSGTERTWMGGHYDPRRRQILAKIVKPGLKPYPYHPYPRKGEEGRSFDMADWREQLVALVAHEAMHRRQHRNRQPYREVDCDLAAYRAVMYYREETA